MKRIVLTGGGTAGHVTPNMALVPSLKEAGYDIQYIGSYNGIEKRLIEEMGIPYHGISSGKLRRYFDPKNFSDPFKVMKGYLEASHMIRKLKPDIVFSKGGFVSVPVVLAAKRRRVPVIIHESDLTPGLANKICIPAATKVCCNFPETLKHLPENKAVLTGSPIRQELFSGKKEEGLRLCGFDDSKPVLLVMGGSLGAVAINNAIRENLDELLKQFQIIHLCGRGHYDTSLDGKNGYKQFEYAKKELSDMIDFAKGVGVSGHSMGGDTAYALCARNEDFVCGINLDGALFGDYTNDILRRPFMQVSCKNNENVVNRVYIRHTEPVYKVLFRDMTHIGFADVIKYILPIKLLVGKLDADVLHENLCKCHLEFFDTYLKKLKDTPELKSSDDVKISVYEADMSEEK